MINKMILQIKDRNVDLNNVVIIENIPNDGQIIETIRKLIVEFNEDEFSIYVFKGIFRQKFQDEIYNYKFLDITLVEFGKYSFKHPFIRIGFEDGKFFVFSYFEKVKSHNKQSVNLNTFINKLKNIKENIDLMQEQSDED